MRQSYVWDGNGWVDPGLFYARKKKTKRSDLASPTVVRDTPEYVSPVTGKPVDGRAERREDLKRSGSREVDPSERLEFNPKTEKQAEAERAQLAAREPFVLNPETEKRLKEGTI